MLISVLFSTCIFFKTGEITDEDSARQVACGVSIKGDSNPNNNYVLSERALQTMNFDTSVIKIG